MRRLLLLAVLVLASSQLVGGWTFPINSSGTSMVGGGSGGTASWYCAIVNDGSIAANDVVALRQDITGGAPQAIGVGSDDQVILFPPDRVNGKWIVYGMSTTLYSAQTLTSPGEDCMYSVVFAPLGGADTTTAVQIGTGASATLGNDIGGPCEASILGADATNVDDAGDFCVQRLATPVVGAAGEGIKIVLTDEDGGGANVCTSSIAIDACVLASLVSEDYH